MKKTHQWTRNWLGNEYIDHQAQEKECGHRKRLARKHETDNQLRQKNFGTEKSWNWRNFWLTTEPEGNLSRLPERNDAAEMIRNGSCH